MTITPLASKSIMIVAGEASGDLHGAGLVSSMLEKNPDLDFYGMGGEELETSKNILKREGLRFSF